MGGQQYGLARMAGDEQQHRVSHTVKHLLHRLPFFYGKGVGFVIPQGTLPGIAFGKVRKGQTLKRPAVDLDQAVQYVDR